MLAIISLDAILKFVFRETHEQEQQSNCRLPLLTYFSLRTIIHHTDLMDQRQTTYPTNYPRIKSPGEYLHYINRKVSWKNAFHYVLKFQYCSDKTTAINLMCCLIVLVLQ